MNTVYSSKTITLKDFDRICRTCLGDEKVSLIIDTRIGDLKIVDLLKYSVMVEVNENDFLPQNICETCLNELYRVYEFKKQCQENEAALKLLTENVPENDKSDKEEFCNITLIKHESSDSDREIDADKNKENDTVSEQYKSSTGNYTTSKKEDPREHDNAPEDPKRRYRKCEICNRAISGGYFRQHIRSHTKEKPYQCKICLQSFSLGSNLKRHKMIHTGERPHVCSFCGKGFIQATSLQAHQKVHQPHENVPSKYTCKFCGRDFKVLARFTAHVEKHTSDSSVRPADKSEETNESRDHVCDICGRAFKTRYHLKAHRLTHGEKSFLCSDCGRGFVRKAALLSHLKVHTGEKPHTCITCKKSFSHVTTLESHMLIHSGRKPFSCHYCSKSFTQASHLRCHLRGHSGEKPYTCLYCKKSFALRGNLSVHMRIHTGETPYVCQVCGKGFYDSSSMKKHHRKHKEM